MDRLQAMQIFARIAEQGSFSRVAEQMRLPRPTVTHAVQYLESRLHVRLLQRTTRKVTLTEEGAAFYERCLRILGELDDAEAMFSEISSVPRGTIRFDLPERIAHRVVVPALPAFMAQYPDLRIVLSASDRLANLIDEGIDCVVRVGELVDSSLVARRICTWPQIIVASPAYIDEHGEPETIEDLAEHIAVGFFSSRTGRDFEWEFIQDGKVRDIKMRSNVSVNTAESYLQCCLGGLGLIQFPATGIADHLATRALVQVMPDIEAPPMPVSLLYPHGRHLPPRVRVFAEWVRELIAEGPKSPKG
ncbi:MAG TPA: LysR family transcriptional regulator [Pararobbsia sp.]|nr:LysR family transcriptional regulator [Pararobbsia sp.]